MSRPLSADAKKRLKSVFRMPKGQTMVSRASTVTNAFVASLIPVIEPSAEEIAEALRILGMTTEDVCCAYCGDKASEWDHLRPLVLNRRPTGYISEITNLVPSCGKCNQSKRNKHWFDWIQSGVKHAPAKRRIPDLQQRIKRLKAFEKWKHTEPVDFERIVGPEAYRDYWRRLDGVMKLMRESQPIADALKKRIGAAHNKTTR